MSHRLPSFRRSRQSPTAHLSALCSRTNMPLKAATVRKVTASRPSCLSLMPVGCSWPPAGERAGGPIPSDHSTDVSYANVSLQQGGEVAS